MCGRVCASAVRVFNFTKTLLLSSVAAAPPPHTKIAAALSVEAAMRNRQISGCQTRPLPKPCKSAQAYISKNINVATMVSS